MGPSLARRIRRAAGEAGRAHARDRGLAVLGPGARAGAPRGRHRMFPVRPPGRGPGGRPSRVRERTLPLGHEVRVHRPARPHLDAEHGGAGAGRPPLRALAHRGLLHRQRVSAGRGGDRRLRRVGPSRARGRVRAVLSRPRAHVRVRRPRARHSRAALPPLLRGGPALRDAGGRGAQGVVGGAGGRHRRPRQRDLAGRRERVRAPEPRALRLPPPPPSTSPAPTRSPCGTRPRSSRGASAARRASSAARAVRACWATPGARCVCWGRRRSRRRSSWNGARPGWRGADGRSASPRSSRGPMGVSERLLRGLVIPAHPLALDARRRLDERRQAALTRYYCAAGAGGIAVGVHTTQFAIRDPAVGLLRPVLTIAMDVLRRHAKDGGTPAGRGGRGLRPHAAGGGGSGPGARARLRRGAAQPGRAAGRNQHPVARPLPEGSERRSRCSASTSSPRWAGACSTTRSGASSWRSPPWWRSRSRPSTATGRWRSRARWPPAGATTSRSTPATTTASSPTC